MKKITLSLLAAVALSSFGSSSFAFDLEHKMGEEFFDNCEDVWKKVELRHHRHGHGGCVHHYRTAKKFHRDGKEEESQLAFTEFRRCAKKEGYDKTLQSLTPFGNFSGEDILGCRKSTFAAQ